MTAEGRSINVTLIFSLSATREVIEAYLAGLETSPERGGDLADGAQRRLVLRQPGRHRGRPSPRRHRHTPTRSPCAAGPRSPRPSSPTSCSASGSRGERWERLADRGAHRQRPLWASTSTKNPAYPDTLYVDSLIGPDTVNTLPESHHRRVRGPRHRRPHHRPRRRRRRRRARPAGRRRRRHGRRRRHPRGPGRGRLPRIVRPRARHARRQGPPARDTLTMDWAGWALFGLLATTALTAVMIVAQLAGLHPPGPAPAARHHRHRGPRPGPGRRVLHPPRRSAKGSRSATPPASPCSDRATWWLGGLFGLVHAAVALTVLVPLLAGRPSPHGVEPRRPGVDRRARAPGLLALNYGAADPVVAIVAHLVYGIALGLLLTAALTMTDRASGDPSHRATDRGLRPARRHPHRRARSPPTAPSTGCASPRFDGDPSSVASSADRTQAGSASGPSATPRVDRPPLPARHRHPRDDLGSADGGRLTLTEGMVGRGRRPPAAVHAARAPAHRRRTARSRLSIDFDPRLGEQHRDPARRSTAATTWCAAGGRLAVALELDAATLDIEPGQPTRVTVDPGPAAHARARGRRPRTARLRRPRPRRGHAGQPTRRGGTHGRPTSTRTSHTAKRSCEAC